MKAGRPMIDSPFRSLEEWGEWINANACPDDGDANQTVLVGTGGRPATREELLAFVRRERARIARDHPDW